MSKTTHSYSSFTPNPNMVFVTDLDTGVRKTAAGIIIPDDNMKDSGVRDRWCKVWRVGAGITDLVPDQWVLVQHGRWSNGIEIDLGNGPFLMWRIDFPEAVLLVADEDPREHTVHKF